MARSRQSTNPSDKEHATPPRIGRPPKNIDPDVVSKLAGIGCTNREIAHVVGCSIDLLQDRFTNVIEQGRDTARTSLRHAMYRAAVGDSPAFGPNVKMMIHLAEQKPGVCSLGLGHRPANTTEPQQQSFDTNCTFAIPADGGKVIVFKSGSDIIAQIHGDASASATQPPGDGDESSTGEG